ncbi:MAG: sensor histidine kinase [Bacteroidota bacterium]
MSRIESILQNRIAANLLIWLFLFFIMLVTVQSENKALTAIITVLIFIPPVYVNNLLILPYFRKQKFLFSLFFLVNTILFSILFVWIFFSSDDREFELSMLVNFVGIMVLVLLSASAIKIAGDSFARRQKEKEAELKLLKAQLNPHFLFNTLNNLYGLSVIKSDKLPDLMLQLSDLLRYSLYETKETFVQLEKEVLYLENYIALEKIRLENTTKVDFTSSGNISAHRIAPMLLIVFVENAFKHVGSSDENQNEVKLNIDIEDNELIFKCENTIAPDSTLKPREIETGKSGMGLENARKRLDLLYPGRYELNIDHGKILFSAELILHL